MTRRTVGLISIILVLVVSFGALMVVPAVRADTTATVAPSAADIAAAKAKLATLKTIGQQIRETAKAVQEKVKAAKAAGKDLTAFKVDITTALKGGRNLRLGGARIRRQGLTETERTQLKAAQTAIATIRKNLQARTKAGAPQAELDALKASLKSAIQARDALLKSFRVNAQTQMLEQLDNLIANANKELALLQGLLARLP